MSRQTPTEANTGACAVCRDIRQTLLDNVDLSKNKNYGGGNTHFEEKKMGSYKTSETRLMEILESLLAKHQKPPGNLILEALEPKIERWWTKVFAKNPDSDKETLGKSLEFCTPKYCCPDGHFGPNCEPCKSCNILGGSCNGNTTKLGTGACECHKGFQGDECLDCDLKVAYKTEDSCALCDEACEKCTGPTAKDCEKCKSGYWKKDGQTCEDVDECEQHGEGFCPDGTYCKNKVGTFHCDSCGPRCNRCLKKDECLECTQGYEVQDNVCVDTDECQQEGICKLENEVCVNSRGSYSCDCAEGFTRSGEECIEIKDEL
ncbi:Cysteine-rich with EGF-like domain protein 2 [Cichlidogyrus casuarinus]|uniref:Cysteine-rich with EGF-like domain protein 2 n=1 Tax=Cichlidogyrus casuarinus TaxID=1844966 RepID=A0ABD2QQV1_9PLAT